MFLDIANVDHTLNFYLKKLLFFCGVTSNSDKKLHPSQTDLSLDWKLKSRI